MNKKNTLILLTIIAILGSIAIFYNANFIFADVGNYTYGYNGYYYLATIPGVAFSLQFIPLTMLVIRSYIRPQYRKRTILHYLRIFVFISLIGLVGAILAGIYAYESFVKPYPFPFYVSICIAVHGFIIVYSILKHIIVKKNMKDDSERKKMTIGYIIYSFILPLTIFFAYDRFGALLLGPLYIQTRTLYMTWPVYLWLIAPMLILLYIVFKGFGIFKSIEDQICYLCLYLLFTVVLGVVSMITGTHNTLFISAISPAFGLDRLGTFPYIFILHFCQTVVFGLYFLLRDLAIKIFKLQH